VKDEKLLKVYTIGLWMLSLSKEYSLAERSRNISKVQNTITKKHDVFHKQIHQVKERKTIKVSKKCKLFIQSGNIAILAWNDSKIDLAITVEATLLGLYYKNKELLQAIYGFKDEDFLVAKTNGKVAGLTMSSLKTVNLLLLNLEKHMSNQTLIEANKHLVSTLQDL